MKPSDFRKQNPNLSDSSLAIGYAHHVDLNPRKEPTQPPMVVGWDLSDGVETHLEGFWKDGVLHITDRYEIVDGSTSTKEGRG